MGNNSEIIIIGDLHLKTEEPFYSSSKKFMEWFVSKDFNNKNNILIQTGDILHNSVSNGKINKLMIDMFFNKLNFKEIHIILGNHDISKRGGNGLLPLEVNERIKIYKDIVITEINKYKCLIIPFMYKKQDTIDKLEKLKSEGRIKYDFIFAHIGDETQTLFNNFIDMSEFKGVKIFGHVHKGSSHYIGTPYITRYDEKDKDSIIGSIRNGIYETIKVPMFLNYCTIEYGKKIIESKNASTPFSIWDIEDAPDIESAYKFYKDIFIRQVHKIKDDSLISIDTENRNGSLSLKDYLLEFTTTNRVGKELKEMLIKEIIE